MTIPDTSSQTNIQIRRQVTGSEDNIDLRRYFGLFLSNWYWFAATLFIAGIISYGINTYSEKVYIISASLLINDQGSSAMTGMDRIIPSGDIFRSQESLQNEIGILKSFSLNYAVMKELPEFHVTVYEIGRRGIAQKKHYKTEPFIVVYDSLKNQRTDVPINIKIKSHETYSVEINGSKISRPEFHFGDRFNESGFDFILKLRDPANFFYNPDFNSKFVIWFNGLEDLANLYRESSSLLLLMRMHHLSH